MNEIKNILVTGGAGLIGTILIDHLNDQYNFSSIDINETKGSKSYIGDLSDLDAIQPAFEKQDIVIHLAADPSPESSWQSNLTNNLIATYNVYEAAKRAGVKRVIFASSNHAQGGNYLSKPWSLIMEGKFSSLEHGQYPLVLETDMIRPDGYYGTAKAFGEAIGSYYYDYFGLKSIHLRIGWVISVDEPNFSPMILSLWLSHRDAVQAFKLAIEAPDSIGNEIFAVTSDNKWKIFSIDKARTLLQYNPLDGAGEEYILGNPPARNLYHYPR